MTSNAARTALVTGATSGLGTEAAAQFAEAGFGRVIITGRTKQKAEAARAGLVQRTGKDVYETLVLDNAKLATVQAAASDMADQGGTIDVLLLNAGLAPAKEIARTTDGLEMTMAASLTGHHLLTMQLLEIGLLAETARIVIAGSEAAR
ncbi:MAG: SDR family NAD(P)-dependent oxidoreductase, partial [Gaiellaceae bacterium]